VHYSLISSGKMAAPSVILGISTDTRTVGLAVLRNGELIDWRVKTFKGVWSKEKLNTILRRVETVLEYYAVTAIATVKADALKESRQQQIFAAELGELAIRKGLRIYGYTIHDLRNASGGRYKNQRKCIADYVLDKYPIVRHEYLKERNNKRQYYFKMFEAVLCAHLANIKEQEM
jgi:hypothetical protein